MGLISPWSGVRISPLATCLPARACGRRISGGSTPATVATPVRYFLGNTTRPDALRRSFTPASGRCRALPAPRLQRPDLLSAAPEPRPQPDCAEAVADGLQGPTINQVVASVAASLVEKLLNGTCTWMASYFDLDDGTLRCLPADPKQVAEIADLLGD